jgi:hypothetical protein
MNEALLNMILLTGLGAVTVVVDMVFSRRRRRRAASEKASTATSPGPQHSAWVGIRSR